MNRNTALRCNATQTVPETGLAPLLCIAAPESAETRFMYMPGGEHVITPSQGGRAVQVRVKIDPASAAQLEAQRSALEAADKKPFFDFNHEDRKASFWPSGFAWSESPKPGVYVNGEWSADGKAAIEGKSFRSFSPLFHVDDVKANPARVIAEPNARPNMGGLVNDPAFRKIEPFFASDATPALSEELEKLRAEKAALETEAGTLRAGASEVKAREEKLSKEKAAAEQAAEELRGQLAAAQAPKPELEELKARAQRAEQEKEKLALEARARREKDADAAIRAASGRGALPPKNAVLIAKWREALIADPEGAGAMLTAAHSHPALGGRITPAASQVALLNARHAGGLHVEVISNAAKDMLIAYNELQARQAKVSTMAEKVLISKQAARLFARELRNNKELLDMPLEAANAVGTLSGTLVSQRTLELLRLQFPVLTSITADFSDEAANYGQTVITRTIGIPAVQTYDPATGWTSSDAASADVEVTINHHEAVPITFDSNTLASTTRRLFEETAPASAYALAKNLVDALYALITPANFTAAAIVAAMIDFGRGTVIDMATALTKRGVPDGQQNRALLLLTDYFGQLSKDSDLVKLAAFGQSGTDMIQTGVLPNVQGFRVIDAANLPDNGAHVVGLGFSKSALVAACRVPNDYTTILPGASFGNLMVVTDPDLGISALQTQYVDHKTASATQRLAWMFGVAKGQAASGQLLTSQ